MTKGISRVIVTLFIIAIARCFPVGSDDTNGNDANVFDAFPSGSPTRASAASIPSPTVPHASDDPNDILWTPDSGVEPEPERSSLGASILGPVNVPTEMQNADSLAPPTTDNGDMPNIKWPMSLSHTRLQTGGWTRQENIETLPIATEMAGVNMRLQAGAIRELHWHKTSEWAYVLSGSVQVTSVDQHGKNFVGTVGPGDLWYFPSGIPHSLQATNDSAAGAEFLLVLDDGSFSAASTFSLTGKLPQYPLLSFTELLFPDWLAHVPKGVIAKNFQTSISAFDDLPSHELFIFPARPPISSKGPSDPQGTIPNPFTYPLSQVPATPLSGGSVKVVDSTSFKVSKTIAAAVVEVNPGGMRELHWHPTLDEWDFFLEGTARMSLYAAQGKAGTWNFQAGDVAYVPACYGHYVENTGNATLKFIEVFKTDVYEDVSLAQWLALTPPAIVQANLGLSDEMIAMLNKMKQVVVGSPTGS